MDARAVQTSALPPANLTPERRRVPARKPLPRQTKSVDVTACDPLGGARREPAGGVEVRWEAVVVSIDVLPEGDKSGDAIAATAVASPISIRERGTELITGARSERRLRTDSAGMSVISEVSGRPAFAATRENTHVPASVQARHNGLVRGRAVRYIDCVRSDRRAKPAGHHDCAQAARSNSGRFF